MADTPPVLTPVHGTHDSLIVYINGVMIGDDVHRSSLSEFDRIQSTTSSFPEVKANFSTFTLDNLWAVFDQQYLRHSLEWTVVLLLAYTVILVVGIVGNIMVILVVVLRPQMRTVTNMFILNLAVADLFVIVFCVPATLLANVFTPWILGSFMCKAVVYVQGVSVCASAYSLAAISLDRYKAIYRALKIPRGLSKYQALTTICFIWTTALLLLIPWLWVFDVQPSKTDGLFYCVETWENEEHGKMYYLVANLFGCYCLPLSLILKWNGRIWCHVSRRQVPLDSASTINIKNMHRKTRHGVRKMLGTVTFTFMLSWLPLYILATRVKLATDISENETELLNVLMPWAQWLGIWNSCINPVLYAFLNSKFREMFKSLLPSWLQGKHHVTRAPIVTNRTCTTGGSPTTASYSNAVACRQGTERRLNSYRWRNVDVHRFSKHILMVTSFLDGRKENAEATMVVTSASPLSSVVNQSKDNYKLATNTKIIGVFPVKHTIVTEV